MTHKGYKKYYSNQKAKLIEDTNKKLEMTKLKLMALAATGAELNQ